MSFKTNIIFDKLSVYLVFALSLGVLFPPVVRNILVIVFVAVALLLFSRNSGKKFSLRYLLLNTGLFLTYVISLFYSANYDIGLKKIETALSLLAFPLIFTFLPQNIIEDLKDRLNTILKFFIVSGVGLVFISFSFELFNNGLEGDVSSYISRIQSSQTIYGMDNMYRSFHLGIALISSFVLLYRYSRVPKWVSALALILISCVLLLIISNKVIVAATFISLFIFAFLANTRKVLLALTLLCAALLTIAVYSPKLNSRITNLFTIKNESLANLTQQEVRENLSICTGKLLPEAGLFGFGIGDAKVNLFKCYKENDSDLEALRFNTHNQYFSIVLISGFLGLLIFLVFILVNITRSLNFKNYTAVVFMIFFAIVMFSENILERHDGIIPFAFITYLLLSFNSSRKEKINQVQATSIFHSRDGNRDH